MLTLAPVGGVSANIYLAAGGAVFLNLQPSLDSSRTLNARLTDVTADSNAAAEGGALFLGAGTVLSAQRAEVTACAATRGAGGGVALEQAVSADLADVSVVGCAAAGSGGGISAESVGAVTLARVRLVRYGELLSHTQPTHPPSMLFVAVLPPSPDSLSAALTPPTHTQANNHALDGGGAALRNGGSLAATELAVTGNVATGKAPRGGGLFLGNESSVEIASSSVVRCCCGAGCRFVSPPSSHDPAARLRGLCCALRREMRPCVKNRVCSPRSLTRSKPRPNLGAGWEQGAPDRHQAQARADGGVEVQSWRRCAPPDRAAVCFLLIDPSVYYRATRDASQTEKPAACCSRLTPPPAALLPSRL